jgi:site-specific DNA-adenine methylase
LARLLWLQFFANLQIADMPTKYKSPYPYFGGKSKIADEIWRRFGAVDRYIEPFFGSGAVLLANPYYPDVFEVINDLDHFVCNFWRALQAAPDEVIYYADYPCIETDLHIRHWWLVTDGADIIKRCAWEEDFYDAKVAGWWVWGMANWIGSQFATLNGSWTRERLKLAEELGTYDINEIKAAEGNATDDAKGLWRQRPHLSDNGQGVNRKRLHLSNHGKGIKRKGISRRLLHLSDDGKGIKRSRLSADKRGINRNGGVAEYLHELAERMREVRVCCGDWSRIVQPAVLGCGHEAVTPGTAGVFLDPPYSAEANRDNNVYRMEDLSVAHGVREWCKANGDNPNIRIALCGYDTEHAELETLGWSVYRWKANGGYASTSQDEDAQGRLNRHRETIWFSPYCLDKGQASLFN